ncbi:MAG: LysM peptidoglycan-binding domain-containing protein [Puniceicoccales bacterium]
MLAVFLCSSCSPGGRHVFEETDEPEYVRGKKFLRQGEEEQALLAFLRVIDNRTDSPESHLEAGLIYLNDMNQPILAIYHFMKFLELRPEAMQAPEVESLIDTAKKEFARTLPGRPFQSGVEQTDLLEVVERQRAENNHLKSRISGLERENQELRGRIASLSNSSSRGTPTQTRTANAGTERAVYVVQPGDTLSSIARKVFGSSARWEEIFQANRDLLRSPNDLRVGQELQIPPE